MSTPLEDQVHDALARRVEPMHHSPLALGDVRGRARRIQRRRRAAAGAVVAVVLAVAIPVGLTFDGPARRSEQPPVDRTPGVAQTVRVDPRSASQGAGPGIPLTDYTSRTVTVGDEVTQLPEKYFQATQYGEGWVATRRQGDGLYRVDILDANLEVEDGDVDTTGFTASPDGSRVAWARQDGNRSWIVSVNDPSRQVADWTVRIPTDSADDQVVVRGFVADDQVLVQRFPSEGPPGPFYYVADRSGLRPLDGLWVSTGSPATHLLAGTIPSPDASVCGVTWGADDPEAGPVWTDCEHRPAAFSPDGSLLAAFPVTGDQAADNDPAGVSLLDAATGRVLVDFEVTPQRKRVVAFQSQLAWEDDEHLLATYADGNEQWVVRLGTDGSVERVAGPVTADFPGPVLLVSPGRS